MTLQWEPRHRNLGLAISLDVWNLLRVISDSAERPRNPARLGSSPAERLVLFPLLLRTHHRT